MSAEAKGSFLTCRALAHIIFSETGDEEDTMAGNHPTERGVKCTGTLLFDLKTMQQMATYAVSVVEKQRVSTQGWKRFGKRPSPPLWSFR